MVKIGICDHNDFVLSDIESKHEGKSYTVKTIELLRNVYHEAEFFFIMGADSLEQLGTWHEPDKLMTLAKLVVAQRPGHEAASAGLKPGIISIDMPLVGISASDIRLRVRKGMPIRFLVPGAVEEYIRREGLYRD